MTRIAVLALFLLLSLLAGGCNSKDADHLANLGSKLGHKARSLTSPGSSSLMRRWPGMPLPLAEPGIDGKVAARLNWDKELAEVQIEVKGNAAVVELSGKVRSLDQKRRALELAQTTSGVEKVVDRMEIGP